MNKMVEYIDHCSIEELIKIIEEHDDYQEACVKEAICEVKERNIQKGEAIDIARQLMVNKVKKYFNNFSLLNDELEIPNSNLLDEEEVENIFIKGYETYMVRRNALFVNDIAYHIKKRGKLKIWDI